MIPQNRGAKILDTQTGRSPAVSTWLAGVTAAPAPTVTPSTLSEDNTTGYARQSITWSVPAVPTDEDNHISSNTAQITFGPFTANGANPWTHIALMEAVSGTTGDVRYVWELDEAYTPIIGGSLVLPIGSVVMGAQ